ncbi:MAG: tryptophan-rich sensory protein [Candidatus Pacearchaeota archaeon]|nr:tryptophan-rich sensory protein [Candidatus Pacearchaeota archaeon]
MKKGARKQIIKRGNKKKFNLKVFVFSFVAVLIVAFLGSLFTDTGSWYDTIKPSITPPNIVFPIAWTTLFILIALSMYFSWINAKDNQKDRVTLFYAINLILNILWTVIFFGMKQTGVALFEIAVLWISVLSLMIINWKISKTATWLLLPYLLWISFATLLNILIVFA